MKLQTTCVDHWFHERNKAAGKLLFVGARLAGDSVFADAFAGKPGSYEKQWCQPSLGFTKSQTQKRATKVALFYGLTELSSVFPFVHATGRPEW